MPAAANNKFKKSHSFLSKTLSSGITNSDVTIPLSDVNNIPTDTAVDCIIDRVDSNGVQTPSKREIITGVVSGSSLISATRGQQATTAQAHSTGAVVEFNISAQTHNDMVDGILTQHTQTGTHQAITNTGGLTTDSLTVSGASTLSGVLGVAGLLTPSGGLSSNSVKSTALALSNALDGTNGVQTYTPTLSGTSGGTWSTPVGYYINLGGLKLAWGTVDFAATAAVGHCIASQPPSFFNTVQIGIPAIQGEGNAPYQTASGDTFTTTSVPFYVGNTTNAASCRVSWLTIGT